jgi:hypothetical protein
MVLSTGCPAALLYEMPELVIRREPWFPRWHVGYPVLIYTAPPKEPPAKRRRELCAVAALKRRRYSRPVPATWVHPWVLAAREAARRD